MSIGWIKLDFNIFRLPTLPLRSNVPQGVAVSLMLVAYEIAVCSLMPIFEKSTK